MAARQSCLQFESAEVPVEREKATNLIFIQEMEREPRKKKANEHTEDGVLDARKAIHATGGGNGSAVLAKSSEGGKAKGNQGGNLRI